MDPTYGDINGHAIGIIMKEMVRRAVEEIRALRLVFEITQKGSKHDGSDDFFTSADTAAQKIYLRTIQECFPLFGVIAEEDELTIACTHPNFTISFTVDPLDGTKAFIRRQSHGIGTMISLVCDNRIISAYVGDVMTQEIYGFRPGSDKTHRSAEHGTSEQLIIDVHHSLNKQAVLLRDTQNNHSPAMQRIVGGNSAESIFSKTLFADGSIGTSMARLWKGEVGAAVLPPAHDTPWDLCPVVGISEHLGFMSLYVSSDGMLHEHDWGDLHAPKKRNCDIIVVHKSRLEELLIKTA